MNFTVVQTVEKFVGKARQLVDISGIQAPPVDPRLLAEIEGIKRVVISPSLSVSGQLLRESDGLVIRLSAKESVERRKFSCCHEIAHAFDFDGLLVKSRANVGTPVCTPSSPEEYLCDRAAAEMLMPEKFFRPLASDLSPSVASLETLSKLFGSSLSATIIRIGQLCVWPTVLVVWKFKVRFESSPKLRVVWSVRPSGYRCYVPRHASADPASGMYASFLGARPTCEYENLNLGSLRGKYLVENGKFGEYVVSIVHDPKLRRAR